MFFAQSNTSSENNEITVICTRIDPSIMFLNEEPYNVIDSYLNGSMKTVAQFSKNEKRVFKWAIVENNPDTLNFFYTKHICLVGSVTPSNSNK